MYFKTGEFECRFNLPSNIFNKLGNEFGVYLNETKSEKLRILDDRSFVLEFSNGKNLLYVKKGF